MVEVEKPLIRRTSSGISYEVRQDAYSPVELETTARQNEADIKTLNRRLLSSGLFYEGDPHGPTGWYRNEELDVGAMNKKIDLLINYLGLEYHPAEKKTVGPSLTKRPKKAKTRGSK